MPHQTARTLALALLLVSCGGEAAPPPEGAGPAPANGAAAGGVAATGDTITVEMITDESGNYFRPAEIEAHRGDVVRFTLGIGVHNVHFLADSNPGVPNLPAASEMLQLPGQTHDVLVDLPAGRSYFFQCDPHALLGMVGHLRVEDDE
jgi:plastocyanin